MKGPSLRPGLSSEARSAILAQHDRLRALVAETSTLARLGAPAARSLGPLRAKARTLYVALDEHMRFEEGLLETALRDVIGRGAELHAELLRDH